jgi:hypothetical protein
MMSAALGVVDPARGCSQAADTHARMQAAKIAGDIPRFMCCRTHGEKPQFPALAGNTKAG